MRKKVRLRPIIESSGELREEISFIVMGNGALDTPEKCEEAITAIEELIEREKSSKYFEGLENGLELIERVKAKERIKEQDIILQEGYKLI